MHATGGRTHWPPSVCGLAPRLADTVVVALLVITLGRAAGLRTCMPDCGQFLRRNASHYRTGVQLQRLPDMTRTASSRSTRPSQKLFPTHGRMHNLPRV